jgi:cold shock CspA family protein
MTGAAAGRSALHGVVTSFDPRAGLGELRLDDGREVAFHATQLADGSRHVDVGARVAAQVVPWHRGQMEATAVTVL